MITDDAMEVHFGLRLLDRVADHAYCQHYPDILIWYTEEKRWVFSFDLKQDSFDLKEDST